MKYYKKPYDCDINDIMVYYCYNKETDKWTSVYCDNIALHTFPDDHAKRNDFIEATEAEFTLAYDKTILTLQKSITHTKNYRNAKSKF